MLFRSQKSVAKQVPPKLANSISYPFYLRSLVGDGSMLLNIGDSGYSNRLLSPLLLFFATHLNRSDAMQVWQDQYGRAETAPGDAWSFLFYSPDVVPQALDLPLNKRFRGSDRIFWRSGWKPGDTLFMLESGNWGPDHYHLDKHQFLLEAFGERMIVDRGMCDYSNPLSLHLHTTASHNTVTIDGQDQIAHSRQSAARLEKLVETENLRYLSSEAGAAYADLTLFRREVLFVRSRYFILADTLAGIRGKLAWHFHTPLHPEPMRNGLILRGANTSLLMYIVLPQPWDWHEELLPLDIDVQADQLFNRLGVTAKIEPNPSRSFSDHHLTLSPVGCPEETHLLMILFPVVVDDEHRVQITETGNENENDRVITIEHAGHRDIVDVATVWRTDLLSALRLDGAPLE